MTKEKLISLSKYLDRLNDKLTAPTPQKHVKHPAAFNQFLEREIKMVKAKIDDAKIEGVK